MLYWCSVDTMKVSGGDEQDVKGINHLMILYGFGSVLDFINSRCFNINSHLYGKYFVS